MFEPWELILHHTYSGSPGVVFDHSPKRGSHGSVVDIDPGDFVRDGQANGSGAVRFRGNGRVTVIPTYGFDRLGAFRLEATFLPDTLEPNQRIFTSRPVSVNASVRTDSLEFSFKAPEHAPGTFLGSQRFTVGFDEAGIDPTTWITAGVLHDGYGTLVITVDGRPVKTWRDRPLYPVLPTTEITIGNEDGGLASFRGLIDDIKVWRPNPHRIKADFTERVVKSGLTDCWAQWGKDFRRAVDELAEHDPECFHRIARRLEDAIAGMATLVLTHSVTSRQAWDQAGADYRRHWDSGDISDIHRVLTWFDESLRAERLNLRDIPDYQSLVDDECLRRLIGLMPPIDCDPQFTRMLSDDGI